MLGFGEEFVLVDDGGDCDFSIGCAFSNAHHAAFAVDVNAVTGGDFGGESEGKFDIGTDGGWGVEVETDAAGTDVKTVSGSRILRFAVLVVIDTHPVGKADG